MAKTEKSPWKALVDHVGTALTAVAVLPIIVVDAIATSIID